MIRRIQGGGYVAEIDTEHGANCISLRHTGYGAEILRERPAGVGHDRLDNPFLYGMPILFPVNRISGGVFSFEGRTYRFPINEPATGCHLHGLLHGMPFAVSEQADNRLCAVFRADAEHPYLGVPHAFEICIEYLLAEEGLTQRIEVVNRSDAAMPCLLGFHTTFRVPFVEGSAPDAISVRADVSEEYERNMENYLPTGRRVPFDPLSSAIRDGSFCPIGVPASRHYRALRDGRMEICDAEKRLKIVYLNDEKLAFRLIYNGTADGYICMEPQTSLANSPNAPIPREEAGFFVIPPEESAVFTSKIYIERF